MTATASVLTTTGPDRDRWIALLEALPPGLRDMHYHPDYMAIYERTYGDRALCIVAETGEGAIWQPVILRRVPELDAVDVTSVYGYGGPLCATTPGMADIAAFTDALGQWAAAEKAVSEFCLLHPFLTDAQRDALPRDLPVTYRKEVVSADLTLPLPALWARIEDRQRKAILAARKKGVTVEVGDGSDADYAAFHDRYLHTMTHVGASDFWHFPDDYFRNCRDCLGPDNATLVHARHDGRIVASVFHIHLYDTVYYHFSCADLSARALNPTPLLLFDSMLWAKSAGFAQFHMGGGRTTGADSLFTFKNAFCGSTRSLYGYTRIFDKDRYAALTAATKTRETETLGAPKDTDFFPRYRA